MPTDDATSTTSHLDFVDENFGRGPVDAGVVVVYAVNHQRATPADVVDRIVGYGFLTRCLDLRTDEQTTIWVPVQRWSTHHNIEAIGVALLQFFPLNAWVLPVKFNVLMTGVEFLRKVHLDSFIRRNDDSHCSVELQELRQYESSRTCADDEGFDANRCGELVHSMHGARRRLHERRLLIGEVVELEHL